MTFAVQTPTGALPSTAKVQELIDLENCRWKYDLVKSTFEAPDADVILQIPLSMLNSA